MDLLTFLEDNEDKELEKIKQEVQVDKERKDESTKEKEIIKQDDLKKKVASSFPSTSTSITPSSLFH